MLLRMHCGSTWVMTMAILEEPQVQNWARLPGSCVVLVLVPARVEDIPAASRASLRGVALVQIAGPYK